MNTTAAEVRGPQPKVHPSAAGPDSGRLDVNAGTIETADGRRVLRAGGEFVTGLLAGLDAEVGDAAGEILYQCGRRQVIVAGMEAHVCVFQTVRDLMAGGYHAFVPCDAVTSRTEANERIGLALCEKAGATLTSTEAVLFDLLGAAGTPEFKELAPLIK